MGKSVIPGEGLVNCRMRKPSAKRTCWVAFVGCLAGGVALNVAACRHAGAMTEFAAEGARTPSPEALDALGKVRVLLGGVNLPRPENRRRPEDVGLGAETIRIPFEDGGHVEAWVCPGDGEGRVLLFHAYGAARDSLLPVAAEWSGRGIGPVLVDFRGSGGSSGNTTTLGFREAEDVREVWRYARNRWPDERIYLYGTSMGGAAVLRAVAAGDLGPAGLVVEGVFDRMDTTIGNRFRAMGLPGDPLARLLLFWGGRLRDFEPRSHNPVDYARSVHAPTLVMRGAEDPRVRSAEARAVFDALAGPREYVEFPGAGHESLLEADPDRWRGALDRFVRANRP